jgi:hypothetical protein
MKALSKLLSIFFLSIVSEFTLAQSASISWPLTGTLIAEENTRLTAPAMVVGSGLTSGTFTADGYRTTSWAFSDPDDFYQYTIATPSNATFVVSTISFNHRDNGGNHTFTVSYSTDGFQTQRNITIANNTVPATLSLFQVTGLNIQMPENTILSIRVRTNTGTNKDYFNRNFTIGGSGPAALPVTLSSFTAKQTTDNKVALAWVTSSESVNKGFSIERQEEGSGKFQSLGFIASKAEGGNSQTTLAYNFKDVTAKNGTNMYRLVQEDLDGTKTYSEVRVVKLSAQSVSNVFPNPSTGAINISRSNDGKKMNVQVLDQSGRVISQVNNIVDSNYRMNLSQPGIYSIKMMYPETGEQSIQRIVVQK